MKEEFLQKIRNHDYIEKSLFKQMKNDYPNEIPSGFDLESYNDKVTNFLYQKYRNYFASMYQGVDDKIHLDEEQIKAIVTDDDYCLILAGAGTGKTTTIASKVKYLVDIKKVLPSRIAVMSYTKKATEELEKRIVVDFNLPIQVTTFHSLGFMYIREIFKDHICYVVDDNYRNQVFYEYFKEFIFPAKDKIKEILEVFDMVNRSNSFLFGSHFIAHFEEYDNFDDYFERYKEDKKKEIGSLKEEVERRIEERLNRDIPITIKGELVKSKKEGMIANFLYRKGIDYHYEKVYKELMEDRRSYKPDFTLDKAGEEIYIEYFGLSDYSDDKLDRYNKIRKLKEGYHASHHTQFIKLDYQRNEDLLKSLEEQLIQFGFTLHDKSDEEIWNDLLDNNKIAQIYPYKNFLYYAIDSIKSSIKRGEYAKICKRYIDSLEGEKKEHVKKQFFYIDDFYHYYQKKLFADTKYGFDFSDMIYYANRYMDTIREDNKLNFDYLIIDEYQDISQERYEFTKNIVNKSHAKIVAVGDDWQSIFSFAGSKIQYIYRFEQYFPGAKILKISHTYRNSQELINYSGEFIMKNPVQIKKELLSNKSISNPIRFVFFDEGQEYDTLKKLLLKIHENNKNAHIMILARTNRMIENCYIDGELKDAMGTKIEYVGYEDIDIDGMTIHKSKGLTCDEAIIIGLNKNFPNANWNSFWLPYVMLNTGSSESFPFAEERRLFYVALTRCKNHVYLLVNRNPLLRSAYINEIYNIVHENDSK